MTSAESEPAWAGVRTALFEAGASQEPSSLLLRLLGVGLLSDGGVAGQGRQAGAGVGAAARPVVEGWEVARAVGDAVERAAIAVVARRGARPASEGLVQL